MQHTHIKDNFWQRGLTTNNRSLYTRSQSELFEIINSVRPELYKLSQSIRTIIDQYEIFAEEHCMLLSNRSS